MRWGLASERVGLFGRLVPETEDIFPRSRRRRLSVVDEIIDRGPLARGEAPGGPRAPSLSFSIAIAEKGRMPPMENRKNSSSGKTSIARRVSLRCA